MKVSDLGVLPQSVCFSFIPADLAKQLYFYPTWCGHYYCNHNYFIKRKSFPSILVAFVRSGKFHVEYEQQTFTASKGDIILLDCRKPHYYRAGNELEFLYINFEGSNSYDICHHILKQIGSLIKQESNLLIGKEIYNMVDFYVKNGIENMFHSSMRIYKILAYLSMNDSFEKKDITPIEKTIHYIRTNIQDGTGNNDNLNLDKLATIAHLSPYYYAHLFRKQTGFSPKEYIINARINQAKVLLLSTLEPIEEIAYKIGYASSSSFITTFIKRVGMTPKQYRQSQQGL